MQKVWNEIALETYKNKRLKCRKSVFIRTFGIYFVKVLKLLVKLALKNITRHLFC